MYTTILGTPVWFPEKDPVPPKDIQELMIAKAKEKRERRLQRNRYIQLNITAKNRKDQ